MRCFPNLPQNSVTYLQKDETRYFKIQIINRVLQPEVPYCVAFLRFNFKNELLYQACGFTVCVFICVFCHFTVSVWTNIYDDCLWLITRTAVRNSIFIFHWQCDFIKEDIRKAETNDSSDKRTSNHTPIPAVTGGNPWPAITEEPYIQRKHVLTQSQSQRRRLTCAQKLTYSLLNLPHGTTTKKTNEEN